MFLHRFDYAGGDTDFPKLIEKEVWSSTDWSVINAIQRLKLQNEFGFALFDRWDGCILWTPATFESTVKVVDLGTCPDIREMVTMSAMNDESGGVVFVLRDSDSDHYLDKDRYVILEDKDGDGIVDVVRKEGGW